MDSTRQLEMSKIDKDISDYVMSEVAKRDYMFVGVFNKYMAINSYKKQPFVNGCFSEVVNKSYEDTLDLMREPPKTRIGYLELIIKRFQK
jgi:hypothetical protein